MNKIVIFGAGGFAKEVFSLIKDINKVKLEYDIVGFYEDNSSKKELFGHKVFSALSDIPKKSEVSIVIAVGAPESRSLVYDRMTKEGFRICRPIIHPSVIIGDEVTIEDGSVVCANSVITTSVKIQKNCLINLMCTVGHDCVIGEHSVLSPSVSVSGHVEIGKACDIGTGTKIKPHVTISDHIVVGLGSAVVKNLEEVGI